VQVIGVFTNPEVSVEKPTYLYHPHINLDYLRIADCPEAELEAILLVVGLVGRVRD